MWQTLYVFVLITLSVFMIFLILIQRGKGGGLAGAFGGMGGQSAFGTKAGDMFTKITVVTAIIWIILCTTIYWTLKHNGYKGIGDSFSENIPAATAPVHSSTSETSDSATSVSTPDASPVTNTETNTAAPISTPTAVPATEQPVPEKKPE
ncbi:MAG: preprotein translocase subunit SecG [Planctomycetaceae bacterium]|jgi:preprotein translocase subunit SecG|nr:preprotein translocase subunit SecG [Planctomycetaceae bacterium]